MKTYSLPQTYSLTLPLEQAKLFEEVLNQLGFTTFRNAAGVGMLGLTIRYERREDLDAAYELYRDIWTDLLRVRY